MLREKVGKPHFWGAKLPNRVRTHRSVFLFWNFPGSNGAEFQTVRTGLSATPRPAKRLFRLPPAVIGAAPPLVAARTTRSLGSSAWLWSWMARPNKRPYSSEEISLKARL